MVKGKEGTNLLEKIMALSIKFSAASSNFCSCCYAATSVSSIAQLPAAASALVSAVCFSCYRFGSAVELLKHCCFGPYVGDEDPDDLQTQVAPYREIYRLG
ncbi:hypothetical protein M9H77_16339 [Catharanthus roseus]|uniref:Uncharacterized protein n=1 Tax=Catharanthus roseus TaxID=4058 RepID=A0ACC0B1I0_CATRO|nr:hypothetical protein M9H77_16339 [Catharanthus roseus]